MSVGVFRSTVACGVTVMLGVHVRRFTRRWMRLGLGGAAAALSAGLVVLSAQGAPQFGDPVAGLPVTQLGLFQAGQQQFQAVENSFTGLGPVFNGRSCAECHSVPVIGGSAPSLDKLAHRFARDAANEPFDPLLTLGGPVLQAFSVSSELPGCVLAAEVVPPEATEHSLRLPPSLLGLGLIEAIPDTAILSRADPTDANEDRIAGRPNISNGVLGRFGWKAAGPTVLDFVALAMVSELGITTWAYATETLPQGAPVPVGCDFAPDIEDADASRLAGLTSFVRFLAPPPRGPVTAAVTRGEALFEQVGCTACHTPSMRTGPNAIPALSEVDVPLYSDLLIHYMGGPLNDHIVEGAAAGGRWRTAPLWGLRVRPFLMHDGRATDLAAAIDMHRGESIESRRAFRRLSATERADLFAFLNSL